MAKLEQETNWGDLVEQALLADESNWSALYRLYDRWIEWSHLFEFLEGGPALRADFPPEMDDFFYRLAVADVPPNVVAWVGQYRARHGNAPSLDDLPDGMKSLIPRGKRGRPRPETLPMRAIAKEWQRLVFRDSYEIRRDIIAAGGEYMNICFGYGPEDVKGDTPSRLALEKLSGETGYSVDYLKDIVQRSPGSKAKK